MNTRKHSRHHLCQQNYPIGRLRAICGFCIAAGFASSAVNAAPTLRFTPGNLLLSQVDSLREYTLDGSLVQTINTPHPDISPCPGCGEARDVTVHPNGRAYVFNDPYLSVFDPITSVWSHQSFAGLSLANNGSYGGLTHTQRYVFLPDMRTASDGQPQGIVRFDLAGGPTMRYAEDISPIDLNVGLDGFLYALHPGGSPSGRNVDVFDPETMIRLRTIDVGRTANRGVAADFDGSLFVVSFNETLYHVDANGALLASLSLPALDTFDVDIAPDGTIAVGSRFGDVMLTNREFSTLKSFRVPGEIVFVSFVPVPEPTAAAMVLTFALMQIAGLQRNLRAHSSRRTKSRATKGGGIRSIAN